MRMASTEPNTTSLRHAGRVQVDIDAISTIEFLKLGYPPRQALLVEDMRMDRLARRGTVTGWPFKNDAMYFAFGDHADVA